MTPDTPPPNDEPLADTDDLGAPVAELQDLSLEVSDRFVRRVRGKIERRVVAGEFLGLVWTAPIMMLLEFLRIPFEAFGRSRRP